MLKIWLPFNKDKRNIGLSQQCRNFTIGTFSMQTAGSPIDDKPCAYGYGVYHMETDEFANGDFTVATWVRKNAAWSVFNNIISCKNSDSSGTYDWYMSIFSSTTDCGIRWALNNSWLTTTYNFALNTWYHVAGTFNGTTKQYKLYVNGTCISSGASNNAYVTGMLNIGVSCRSTNAAGTTYTGDILYISDHRVYNHELKDWEIKKIYNNKSYEMEGNFYLEATENLNIMANGLITDTAHNGANSKYGYNDASNLRKDTVTVDGWKCSKVTIRSGNTAVYPYVFFSPLHPSSGTYKTLSFDYYPTQQTRMIPYTYGGAAITSARVNYGDWVRNTSPVSSQNVYVNANQWNHIDFTLRGTTSASTGWGYFRIGGAKFTGQTSDYWLFRHVQITNKDHPTRYTEISRSAQIADLSGADNIATPINVIQSGSSVYFNGTDSAIQIPLHGIISAGTWTINLWFYRPNGQFGTKSWETLIGGPSGFELSSSSSSTKTAFVCPHSWGGGKYPYDMDRWNMVTLSRTPSASKLYLNGDLVKTGSVGSMPAGDYFIGAWKTSTQQNFKGYMKRFSVYRSALSDEDIMNLYIHNE